MAETQDARIGWGGEVWLHNGTALVELVQVVSFGLPNDEEEEVEKTHLKSPGRRREFIGGLIDGGEIEVVLNYRPGSDTDTLLRSAKAARDSRPIKLVIPDEDGQPDWQITTTGRVRGLDRGEVTADGKLEVTATIRITAEQTEATAS